MLTLEGPEAAFAPDNDIAALFAACCAQVLGAFVPLALDQPQAKPLEVAGGELVQGEGVGCAGDGGLGPGQMCASCDLFTATTAICSSVNLYNSCTSAAVHVSVKPPLPAQPSQSHPVVE